MRYLFLLRGAPGSGKSTWVKENELDSYTISTDTLRLMYQSPVTNIDGTRAISQNHDTEVWKMVFDLMERRMDNGELVIVDATHYKSSLINKYKDLISKYRYRVYVVDFTNVDEEELKRRNKNRGFRNVPDDVIEKMCVALKDDSEVKKSYKIISPQEAANLINSPLEPYIMPSDIEKVVIFGDIHGCYEPLKEYFDKNPFSDNVNYIFTGDYLDRGIQNKEVLEFLISLKDYKNVIFLEGNHECLHKNTEILTSNGWYKISDIVENKLNITPITYNIEKQELQKDNIQAYHKKYQEKMIHIKTCNTEQIVSFNHDVLINNKKMLAKDVLNMDITDLQKKILPTSKMNLEDYPISDDWLRLITYIVCDGCLVFGNKTNPNLNSKPRVQFGLAYPEKIEVICNVLEKLNIHYTKRNQNRTTSNLPCYVICVYPSASYPIFEYFPNGKQFPQFFRDLSQRQLDIVLQAILQTDGHKSYKKIIFSSTSLFNINILNELCIKHGYCFTITKKQNKGYKKGNDIYSCKITKNWDWVKKQNCVEEIDYNDYSYCITTDNGTLVTRINGKSTITGNCHLRKYADKHFNMEDYIKEEIIYKDPFVTKVLAQLRDRFNTIAKKISTNNKISEELSKLLRESWETNPNNKEVYYEFELVNVPEKQKQLHAEIRVAELQLDILRRYINVLQHEEHNTKDYIKTINEWYKEQFNCGLSLDITNILTKNYAVTANKQDNPIKSPEFIKRTYPQIKDIDKAEIRRFCDRLAQMSYFTFNGFNYFVCHGGLPCLPTMKTQTIEMIKGVGKYEEHEIIDEQFCKNTDSHTYQIHAHRNIFNEPLKLDGTANLEGKVEFGGHLRIIELTKDNVNCIEIKNNVFAQIEEKPKEEKTHLEILRDMYRSPLVQVKELGDNIISLNFTREAFYDKKWNDLTCKARGLFVDKTNGNIVCNSYTKFFNRSEHEETKPEALKNTFQYPVIGYKKENGFLALISKYQYKVHFFTKSTNQGDYVNWFIGVLCDKYNIYYETDYKNYSYGDIYNIVQNNNNCCKNDVHLLELNKHILQSMKQTLIDIIGKYIEEGKTYIFECVDIKNDPHIIKYDESNVYLLDVKNNNFNEEYMPYEDVCKVAEQLNVPVKQPELQFNTWEEFNDWRMKFSNGITQWDCKHEGYVMVDANNFRVKYKSAFYSFWKQMRAVKESIQRGSGNKKIYKTKEEIQVVKLLESTPKEELKQMSIIDIEDIFYKEYEV